MKHNTLHLTALILARTSAPRGEGEPAPEHPPRLTREEWQAKRRADLAEEGIAGLVTKVADLEYDLRETRRKVPKEGARVLTPEEAADYDALVALGKPADVQARLQAGEQASAQLSQRQRGDHLREVADATGTNLKVLTRLSDGLEFEIGPEVDQDGKKTRPVTVKDSDGKTRAFSELLKDDWAEFAPSLVKSGTNTQEGGATFVPQDASGAGAAGGGSWAQNILKNQDKAGGYVDPLQPKATTGGVTP